MLLLLRDTVVGLRRRSVCFGTGSDFEVVSPLFLGSMRDSKTSSVGNCAFSVVVDDRAPAFDAPRGGLQNRLELRLDPVPPSEEPIGLEDTSSDSDRVNCEPSRLSSEPTESESASVPPNRGDVFLHLSTVRPSQGESGFCTNRSQSSSSSLVLVGSSGVSAVGYITCCSTSLARHPPKKKSFRGHKNRGKGVQD